MPFDVPTKVIVAVVIITTVVIAAFVVLTLTGHDSLGYELPVIVTSVIAVMAGQKAIHDNVNDANDKLQSLLNGGTEDAVRKVVREELARLVAVGEANGSTTVQDAGRGLAVAPIEPTPAASPGVGSVPAEQPVNAPQPPAVHYSGDSNPQGS